MEYKKPKLSVIVPVYNTERYVERCLDSILSQTWKDLEVIVVDDCSPGNIAEIVESYQKEFTNIRLLRHEKNKGLFQARITGLNAFSGDYFAFVDSDDWIGVDYFRIMMSKAELGGADIVTADHLQYIEKDKLYYAQHDMLSQKNWDLRDKMILKSLMEQKGLDFSWWVVWNKIYSRSLWEKSQEVLNEFQQHLIMCEDIAFSVNFFCHAKHLVSTHNNYYYYYKGESSATQKKYNYEGYEKNITDIENAFDIAKSALEKNGFWAEEKDHWQQWRDKILRIWLQTIENDHSCSKHRELEFRLKNLIATPTPNLCDADVTFCARGSLHELDYYEEIKQAIASPDTEVVSFDIFDTLVVRPFFNPTDLFFVLAFYVNHIAPSIDYNEFTGVRIAAEKCARERKWVESPSWEDVTLDEIYSELSILCPAMIPYLPQIKEKEIELEERFCNVRRTGKELLDCALASDKRVICTSDMYLSKDVLKKILEKNDLNGISEIYVSCEAGLSKSTGHLFKRVLKIEGLAKKPKAMIHIGDNYSSDVEQPRNFGIRGYHLPKTTDLFRNSNPVHYAGDYFNKMFCQQNGLRSTNSAQSFWGIRCMLAVVANKLYDNPFVFYAKDSDFNVDSYTIGYFVLGMYTFAIGDWLHKSVQDENFDNLNFMARDGYLPYKAFDVLNKVYHSTINTSYLHLSRKSILPVMIEKPMDFYALYNNFTLSTLSPRSFLKIATPIIYQEKLDQAELIVEKFGLPYNSPFQKIETFLKFEKLFFKEFFNANAAEKYRKNLQAYLDPIFSGNSATFDVGYNARCESILVQNFHYKITAHYIHINNDRPFGRIQKTKVRLKTIYQDTPFITGSIREHMMSELAPSCLGYREENGVFGPYFEKLNINLQTRYITSTMQEAAMDFVNDMVDIFGDELQYLAYRPVDACLPMEYYLNESKEADRTLFKGVLFEDDMGMGKEINMFELWQSELQRWGGILQQSVKECNKNQLDYDQYPFFKRWCLIWMTDWSVGKQRCTDYLRPRHPYLYQGIVTCYHGIRSVYRIMVGNQRIETNSIM